MEKTELETIFVYSDAQTAAYLYHLVEKMQKGGVADAKILERMMNIFIVLMNKDVQATNEMRVLIAEEADFEVAHT